MKRDLESEMWGAENSEQYTWQQNFLTDFNGSLSKDWKIIETSRITITILQQNNYSTSFYIP